jgi:probable rRNA maturation factor
MLSPDQLIQFHYDDVKFSFSGRRLLKKHLVALFRREKVKLEKLDYIFVSDARLLEINKQHLSHDFFTDIITFPLHESGHPVVGEIYISIDRVRENAIQFQQKFQVELSRVIFHGALHLCGYRDKSKTEQQEMRKQEDRLLRLLQSVPRGT